jgi:carboxylesterase
MMKGTQAFSMGRSRDTGVLLMHGFTSTPDSQRAFGAFLARAGLTVECPLLSGHGTDWREMAATPYTAWIGDAEKAYLRIRKKCRKVFVAGLSMGGGLALLLAERHPEIAGVIAINNVMIFRDPRLLVVGLLKRFLASTPAIGSDLRDPRQKEITYDRTPTASVHELLKLTRAVRRDLRLVKQPLLVFKSRHDHVIPRVSAVYTYRNAGSADKELVWLDRSYHVATMDVDREIVFKKSLEFIRQKRKM